SAAMMSSRPWSISGSRSGVAGENCKILLKTPIKKALKKAILSGFFTAFYSSSTAFSSNH
ncbi:MAG: hypothetical protein R3310_14535, partial [Candidatus Competibacteraceae bacterium]|nr:hypothetical protein [Candidatus Competibacteraceae bacterium]